MLNEERQRTILEVLGQDGRVLVVDLAKHFRTSEVTIRKDLDVLHVKGRIHRTHGGALPVNESALEDPTLLEKEKLHRKEKLQIAAAAVRMITEGQVKKFHLASLLSTVIPTGTSPYFAVWQNEASEEVFVLPAGVAGLV
jgi:DeoR/GlpR family transcriptional regulator of sugar metabolism